MRKIKHLHSPFCRGSRHVSRRDRVQAGESRAVKRRWSAFQDSGRRSPHGGTVQGRGGGTRKPVHAGKRSDTACVPATGRRLGVRFGVGPPHAGGGGRPNASGMLGTGARNIVAISAGRSMSRWRAVRTTLAITCWVSAPLRSCRPTATLYHRPDPASPAEPPARSGTSACPKGNEELPESACLHQPAAGPGRSVVASPRA